MLVRTRLIGDFGRSAGRLLAATPVIEGTAQAPSISLNRGTSPDDVNPKATSATTTSPGRTNGAPDLHASRIEALRQRVESLLEDSVEFWLKHGHDPKFGGFHGKLNRFGEPAFPDFKGLVQQTRHLWALSAYYRHLPPAAVERRDIVRQRADDLLQFVEQRFLDPADGEFFWHVDRQGNIIDRSKCLYGESFAIYGLAEYAIAFDSERARTLALACFRAIDQSCHDARFGGYDQTRRTNWGTPGAAKDTNTHIHLMESLTNLYAATKDPEVWQRARELVELVLTRHVQPLHHTHSAFTLDFTPVGVPAISYGHDIETAWLLFEAIDVLLLDDATNKREQAFCLGENASKLGFDALKGGFFEEGLPGAGPTKLEKVWWVQAEAIAGLFRMYQHRRDVGLLDQLERTLGFVEKYLHDPNQGEWYWGVLPDGSLGEHRDDKGEEWKASYHVVRSLLFTRAWMTQTLVGRTY